MTRAPNTGQHATHAHSGLAEKLHVSDQQTVFSIEIFLSFRCKLCTDLTDCTFNGSIPIHALMYALAHTEDEMHEMPVKGCVPCVSHFHPKDDTRSNEERLKNIE